MGMRDANDPNYVLGARHPLNSSQQNEPSHGPSVEASIAAMGASSGRLAPNGDERAMTYGEKAVGLTFNPSGDPKVQKLKELYAEIVDICHNAKNVPRPTSIEESRLWAIAITEAQGAQMWAVKAATWRD